MPSPGGCFAPRQPLGPVVWRPPALGAVPVSVLSVLRRVVPPQRGLACVSPGWDGGVCRLSVLWRIVWVFCLSHGLSAAALGVMSFPWEVRYSSAPACGRLSIQSKRFCPVETQLISLFFHGSCFGVKG